MRKKGRVLVNSLLLIVGALWLTLAFLLLALVGTKAMAQADATTTVTTTATCCSLRFDRETMQFAGGAFASAVVELSWIASDGTVSRSEVINITDGDPLLTSDDLLSGLGTNGSPLGYIRAVTEQPAGETGTLARRWRRRRLQWLKNNVLLSNNDVVIQ